MSDPSEDVGAALSQTPATPAPAAGTAPDVVALRAERAKVWRGIMGSADLTDAERAQGSRRLLQIDTQIRQGERQAERPADPRAVVPKTAADYHLDVKSVGGTETWSDADVHEFQQWLHGQGFTRGQGEGLLNYGAFATPIIQRDGSAALTPQFTRSRDAQFDALGLTAAQRKEAAAVLERWAHRVDEEHADEATRRRRLSDISGMEAPGHVRR